MAEKTSVKTAAAAVVQEAEKIESEFSKSQILASDRFRNKRDLLAAVLKPDKKYTVKAVEQEIESYMKGQVK